MISQFQTGLAPFTPTGDYQDWRGGLAGKYMPGALAEEVLPSLGGPHLFIYLFRRFGPTNWPWDQARHLVEYVLTPPLDGVYLTVIPDIQSLYDMRRLMFGYLLAPERAAVVYGTPATEWPAAPLYKESNEAFRATLMDLLHPVWLYGQAINAAGIVTDHLAELPEPAKVAEVYPMSRRNA